MAANADGNAKAPAPMTVFVKLVTDDKIEALPCVWTSRIVLVDLTDRVEITLLRRSSDVGFPLVRPTEPYDIVEVTESVSDSDPGGGRSFGGSLVYLCDFWSCDKESYRLNDGRLELPANGGRS